MSHARLVRLRAGRILFWLALFAFGQGCGGSACSCAAPLPNGFPANERHPNATQVRLSETAIAFLEENTGVVFGSLVPGGLAFDVPEMCGGTPEICCGSAPGECRIEIDLEPQPGDPPRLELAPEEAAPQDTLAVVLRARMTTPMPLPVGILIGTCDVGIDTENGDVDSITITLDVDFVQDAIVGTTRIQVGNVAVTDLEDVDIEISGGLFGSCSILESVRGLLIDQLVTQMEDQLSAAVEGNLCKTCMAPGECAPFATCNADGICELGSGDATRCLQEVGMSGRVLAAALLGGLSPGQPGGMDVYDVAGGYGRTNSGGLSLGLLGGAIAPDGMKDPCVPAVAPPATVAIPESLILQANTRDEGPFDVAFAMHESLLNRNAWAAQQGGVLCMNIGTRSIDLLNTDTLGLLASSMSDLTHGKAAPVLLALRPQMRPLITLGKGTFTTSPSGERIIDDPLLTIRMDRLEIDFYMLVDDRYTRIFTLTTDLVLPINLEATAEGQLAPVLGDAEGAFTNLSVMNSELLIEDPAEIAAKFPALLSLAVPFLGGALAPIDLPALGGIQLAVQPDGITSIDDNSFLAIFADLALPPSPKPTPRVTTTLAILSATVPPTTAFRAPRFDRALRPSVELELGGAVHDARGAALEWQLRVDDGLWSPWTASTRVRLGRETFWLQGRHLIEARARIAGRPETTDFAPASVDFLVDTLAPAITLAADAAATALLVSAQDSVTSEAQLVASYRFGNGAFITLGALPASLALGEADPASLEVRVVDEAGNTGIATGANLYFHGRVPAPEGCGCAVAPRSNGPTGLLFVCFVVGAALIGLRVVVRRRRSAAALTASILAVSVASLFGAAGCGGSNVAPTCGEMPEVEYGAIGRWVDLAADDNRVVLSAYDEAHGDLVVADVALDGEPDAPLQFHSVDGVPDEPPGLCEHGYRGGVTSPGSDVGAYTSIALADGLARIAYQDRTAGALRFAREASPGVYVSHVVDPGVGTGAGASVGAFASLTLDALGAPAVAYMAHGLDDGAGGKLAQLRFAQASSNKPATEADWVVTILHEQPIPCAGLCGDGKACVAETVICTPVESGCDPVCGSSDACVGATCVPILPAPVAPDLVDGTGLFASAARLNDGRPVIAFHDRVAGDLLLATLAAGGTFQVLPLDAAPDSDTGQWSSLVVAPDGLVHVAYQDSVGDRLLHLTWDGVQASPATVIDDGVRPERPHPVGGSAALVVNASGALAVAYQDQALSDLLFARRQLDGSWQRSELYAGPEGFGFHTAAAAQGDTAWVATYVYDRDTYPPGELRVTTLP